jgi:hypothetical protein
MRLKKISLVGFAAAVTALIASPASAAPPDQANPSCTAQFVAVVAPEAVPFGQIVVVPEVRDLTFGGPNLGQEVKVLFATADRSVCPVTP